MKAKNVVDMFLETAKKFPDLPMRGYRNSNEEEFKTITYRAVSEIIENFAISLIELGVKFGDKVALISNNRLEWIISDLAILSIGAVDVPRGSDSTDEEIAYIINHSESIVVIAENIEQAEKIEKYKRKLRKLKHIILIEATEEYIKQKNKKRSKKKYYLFYDLIQKGEKQQNKLKMQYQERINEIEPDTLATIIYTSGTTGEPKGVMLLHKNFMHNVNTIQPLINVNYEDVLAKASNPQEFESSLARI
jgi:long-chain acyl-CoA synthetase